MTLLCIAVSRYRPQVQQVTAGLQLLSTQLQALCRLVVMEPDDALCGGVGPVGAGTSLTAGAGVPVGSAMSHHGVGDARRCGTDTGTPQLLLARADDLLTLSQRVQVGHGPTCLTPAVNLSTPGPSLGHWTGPVPRTLHSAQSGSQESGLPCNGAVQALEHLQEQSEAAAQKAADEQAQVSLPFSRSLLLSWKLAVLRRVLVLYLSSIGSRAPAEDML